SRDDQEEGGHDRAQREQHVRAEETPVRQRAQHLAERPAGMAPLLLADDPVEQAGEEGGSERRQTGNDEERRHQAGVFGRRVVDYRQLGSTGIRVSELCLGTMTFGREADEPTSRKLVDRFLETGGNFVDTADVYAEGESEEITGRALQGRRDDVVLTTKVRFPTGPGVNDVGASRRHIRMGIEASLRRLGTEWIDLYQIHCWDARTPLEETLSTLDDLVHEGKIRYAGASNYTAWQLAKSLGLAAGRGWDGFVSLQPEYSLITRDIERELLPLCREEGLAVLPWSPLAGGVLTWKYREGED